QALVGFFKIQPDHVVEEVHLGPEFLGKTLRKGLVVLVPSKSNESVAVRQLAVVVVPAPVCAHILPTLSAHLVAFERFKVDQLLSMGAVFGFLHPDWSGTSLVFLDPDFTRLGIDPEEVCCT